MRAYCDFYEVAPSDEALTDMALALLDEPDLEGVQLIARDDHGRRSVSRRSSGAGRRSRPADRGDERPVRVRPAAAGATRTADRGLLGPGPARAARRPSSGRRRRTTTERRRCTSASAAGVTTAGSTIRCRRRRRGSRTGCGAGTDARATSSIVRASSTTSDDRRRPPSRTTDRTTPSSSRSAPGRRTKTGSPGKQPESRQATASPRTTSALTS